MCGGLAARLHEPAFREGIVWLIDTIGDAARLPTIMCNGLAARLHGPAFREDLAIILSKSTNPYATLCQLVRYSPHVAHIAAIRARVECDSCAVRQLGGTHATKKRRLREWECG